MFLGKLTLDALPGDPITQGAAISMAVIGLIVVGLLFYFKKWTWLYKEWLTTLDPKRIGIMYAIVAVLMMARGVADAAMMRIQQIVVASGSDFISADQFQQVFSAHGTIMIFFVAMGLMFALINWILPLQLGARDVAFPFLNSLSFWLFAAGMALINLSLLVGEFSAAGWLAYPPLSGIKYSPGVGVDYWIWSLQIAGLGSLLSGINFIVTILKMRAPGMSLMKMPVFVWSVLCSMVLVIFAFPILTVTLTLLALDRTFGTHFFTPEAGGNPMMYINLIWAWGHPEVYILILPAFGIFSEVVATFSRKRLFGYKSMVWALAAITFLSFIVWGHHFFTMGAGANVNAFFGIMTAVIAVPTGVKMFNWLFTMYQGRVHFKTPMYWFLGFVATFTVGGMTGVLLSIPAFNYATHNTLFVVAHFHNMIIGGVVFGYFAGITYWFPKVFGFKLNEALGKIAFWFWIIGYMMAFIPLYILGLMGAARRMDSYDPSLGWQELFIVAGIGVGLIIVGIGFQVLQIIVSIVLRHANRDHTGDPWNGRTLEWSTSSPAPVYNFARIPEVDDRDWFWNVKRLGVTGPNIAKYEDIHLPKNSPFGIIIAGCCFAIGFAVIWNIWWLAVAGLVGAIAAFIVRSTDDNTEYTIPAAAVANIETTAERRWFA